MACGTKVCGVPTRSVAWALVLGGSLALLIWAKLRLVTTVPRTAYADPELVQSEPKPEATPSPAPPAE
jgi:hypothetical protein